MSLGLFSWPWGGSPPQAAKPYFLTDRVLACIYEEDRESWNKSYRRTFLSEGYKSYLQLAAQELKSICSGRGGVQFFNLSPAWLDNAVYADFNKSVFELPTAIWEKPSGLALCPLHILFLICTSMHSWLSLSPDNIVVLHARTCTGTERHFIHLVAACHLIFSVGCDSIHLAMKLLPPLGMGGGPNGGSAAPGTPKSGGGGGWGLMTASDSSGSLSSVGGAAGGGRGVRSSGSQSRTLLPGQLRYGSYFTTLLHRDEELPATCSQRLLLRQVVCSKLGCFAEGGMFPDSPMRHPSRQQQQQQQRTTVATARTLLVVFQRGRQIWSQGASLATLGEEDDTVIFDVGLPVCGDVTVAIWFTDHFSEWDPPALAYAFHTAFVDCEGGGKVVRAKAHQLDVPGSSLAAAQYAEREGFFLDLKLLMEEESEEEQGQEREEGQGPRQTTALAGEDLTADVERLRSSWADLIEQTEGWLDFKPAPAGGGMHDVTRELRAVQAAGLNPSQIPRSLHSRQGSQASSSRVPSSRVSSAGSSPRASVSQQVPPPAFGPPLQLESGGGGGGGGSPARGQGEQAAATPAAADSGQDRQHHNTATVDAAAADKAAADDLRRGDSAKAAIALLHIAAQSGGGGGGGAARRLDVDSAALEMLSSQQQLQSSAASASVAPGSTKEAQPGQTAASSPPAAGGSGQQQLEDRPLGPSPQSPLVVAKAPGTDVAATAAAALSDYSSKEGEQGAAAEAEAGLAADGTRSMGPAGGTAAAAGPAPPPPPPPLPPRGSPGGLRAAAAAAAAARAAGGPSVPAPPSPGPAPAPPPPPLPARSPGGTRVGPSPPPPPPPLPGRSPGRASPRPPPAAPPPPPPALLLPGRLSAGGGGAKGGGPPPPPPPPLPPGVARTPGGKRGLPPPPPFPGAAARQPLSIPGTPGRRDPGAPKLRAFYWSSRPALQSGTLWSDIAPVGGLPQPYGTALTRLFEVRDSRPATPASAARKERGGGGAAVVRVIGLPRANNVSIMLTQFSAFKTPEAIRAAVLAGSEQLGLEHLSLLLQIAPTAEEAKALRMFRGPASELSPPEQFLLVMAAVPRLISKVQALIFRKQFQGLCGEALAGMETLRAACTQIRSSARLRRVLALVLAAGNQLNEGTARGGAAAVKLESLLKLNDVKVTAATAGPAAAAPRPPSTTRAAPEQQAAADASGAGAGAAGAGGAGAAAAETEADGAAAAAAPPLPAVKTLLEFIAWAALEQEQVGISSSSPSSATASAAGGTASSSSDSTRCATAAATAAERAAAAERGERLARSVRGGFLAQELPDLALAVRRMQTDVADSMRSLEGGMRNLQQELAAELEQQQQLKDADGNGTGNGNSNSNGGSSGKGGMPGRLAPGRQAAFNSELEAAAARGGGDSGGGTLARSDCAAGSADGERQHQEAEAEGQGTGEGEEPLPPFASMLSSFLAAAQQQQQQLEATSKQTSAVVQATVEWLGEEAGDKEAAVFEMLLNFQTALDLCCKKVHRQMTAGAAAADARQRRW